MESCQALDAGPGESGASTGAEDAERGEVESQGQMSLVRLDDAAESAGVTQEVERKDAGMVSHDSVSESTLSRSALPLSVRWTSARSTWFDAQIDGGASRAT